MSQRTTLAYVVLRCSELSAARAFYEALGLVFVEEKHGKGPLHLSCDLNGMVLELYPRGKRASGAVRLGLYVEDVEAALRRVEALGFETSVGEAMLVRDADDNIVELLSRANA